MVIERLQQVGLSRYEAEAYAALLAANSLTGYELGKRSAVPLSRSYEILERLVGRGLALIQPGDPPRYRAERPEALLARLRAEHVATLSALEAALAAVTRAESAEEFWVVRGRAQVLRRMQEMCAGAVQSLALAAPPPAIDTFRGALADAAARGCRIGGFHEVRTDAQVAVVLVDGREALVGALAPDATCQAVVAMHRALIAVLSPLVLWSGASIPASASVGADWVRWEDEKRRRLLALAGAHHAA